MTRNNSEQTNGTDNDSEDRQPSQNEGTETGEQRDTALTQARHVVRNLSHSNILSEKEAQAFAFREVAGLDRQQTAEETGLSPHDVDAYLCSASVEITNARKYLEIIDEARRSVESRNG
jgi:DNA-directed RNA polymerase specialized sigma24 family protein